MTDLLYHGGPILVIGLNEAGRARYWYWPKDEEIVIPQETLERIEPFLKDSLLLCEYHKGDICVWGAVDTNKKVVVSMLATEMAAETLQMYAMERVHKKGPRKVVTTPIELAGLSQLITRPETAFPLHELGQHVSIKRLVNGRLEIVPMQLPEPPTD